MIIHLVFAIIVQTHVYITFPYDAALLTRKIFAVESCFDQLL